MNISFSIIACSNIAQKLLKQAAETTAKVMSLFLIPAVETVIDEGTQVTN
jgi:hypothetical protein